MGVICAFSSIGWSTSGCSGVDGTEEGGEDENAENAESREEEEREDVGTLLERRDARGLPNLSFICITLSFLRCTKYQKRVSSESPSRMVPCPCGCKSSSSGSGDLARGGLQLTSP
jgi:hypothetical protein